MGLRLRSRPRAAPLRSQQVQAAAGGNPIQPGTDRRASLECAQPLPSRQQRLLHGILGVVHRTEEAIAMQLQLMAVGVDEVAERIVVSGPRPVDQVGCYVPMLAPLRVRALFGHVKSPASERELGG